MGGVKYKYVVSVIDIFRNFVVVLRPLKSKESTELTENLRCIYNENGLPDILYSDQGTESKGVVKTNSVWSYERKNYKKAQRIAYICKRRSANARGFPGIAADNCIMYIYWLCIDPDEGWRVGTES